MDLEREAKRFDSDGEYVRRWLPVLSRLPTAFIHEPWNAPLGVSVVGGGHCAGICICHIYTGWMDGWME